MSIERLMTAARAAGFAMATPDDLHQVNAPRKSDGWKSALPAVVEKPQRAAPEARQGLLRDWIAMLSFRAPA